MLGAHIHTHTHTHTHTNAYARACPQQLRAKKAKNIELLTVTEDLTRAMNGACALCEPDCHYVY